MFFLRFKFISSLLRVFIIFFSLFITIKILYIPIATKYDINIILHSFFILLISCISCGLIILSFFLMDYIQRLLTNEK
jgi:hypothetical protein